ncbi:hypothetical protein BY996DRAFT_6585559, partial [Phakopsora pachyrhizi]
ELVKRPTSIAISPDGKSIVIADKSVTQQDAEADSRPLTADRDEHVRLSNYPKLLVHLWISPGGGGDDEVYVWDHLALKSGPSKPIGSIQRGTTSERLRIMAMSLKSDQKVMFHDFMDPILDVIDVSSPSSSSAESGHSQIMVSLDTSVRSSNEPSLPLFRILSIDGSENASVTVKSIDEISKQEDLYPELLLFSKDQSIVRSNVKSFDDSKDEIRLLSLDSLKKDRGGRNGKKAEGRVIVQERVQKYLENMKSK